MTESWTYRVVRRKVLLGDRILIIHAIHEVSGGCISGNPISLDTDEGLSGIRDILAKSIAALQLPELDYDLFMESDA